MLNPLFRLAVLSGSEAAVQLHARRCHDINERDSEGRSALILAVVSGYAHCCKVLLEAGADPKLPGTDGLDAMSLAIRAGRADLKELVARYIPLPVQNPEIEAVDDELWIEEPEASVPAHDASCFENAIRFQNSVSDYVFVDEDEDWSDVYIDLPETSNYSPDVDDQLRDFLESAMRTCRSSHKEVYDLAMNLSGEDEAHLTVSRITVLLGDAGVILDEIGCLDGHRPDPKDRLNFSLSESMEFLRDLENPITEPFNCFVRDTGRRKLLSSEREAQLAMEIEKGFEKAAQELSFCSAAIMEVFRIGDLVIAGKTPLEAVVDSDRARRCLSEPDELKPELAATDTKDERLNRFISQMEVLRRKSICGSRAEIGSALCELHLSSGILGRLAKTAIASGSVSRAEAVCDALKTVEGAVDEFFSCNIRLVIQIARRYVRPATPLSDLIQEGSTGLLKAIGRFDWRKGYRFSTYATWWIRQTVSRAMANDGRLIRLPVHVGEAMRIFSRTVNGMRQEFGREPSWEEVAARLTWSVKKVHRHSTYAEDIVSLDSAVEEPDSEQFMESGSLSEKFSQWELSRRIEALLLSLSRKEAEVIKARFGIGTGCEQTLEEIGTQFNVTRERIRQIEAKALIKLRHPVRRAILRDFAQSCELDHHELPQAKLYEPGSKASQELNWSELGQKLNRTSRERRRTRTAQNAVTVRA